MDPASPATSTQLAPSKPQMPTPFTSKLKPELAPEGWTADPFYLDYEDSWASDDSYGRLRVQQAKLERAEPIMTSTPKSGNGSVMFESGGKFYIWNMLNAGIWEILHPQDLDSIIHIMNTRGERSWRVRELHR